MTVKLSKKALPIILALAMIFSLFGGLCLTASAYTPTDTMTNLYNSGNPASSGTYYSISSAAEMGYFASYVNNGKNTSGVTFYLTQDITLSGSWTPAGNATYTFAGKFDGCDKTLSSLSVSYISGKTNYYGLIGKASGPILNLKVNGTIDLSTNSVEYVGGIVGYTTSDVYNCHTNVAITGTNSYQVGGVVGAIENTATSAITHPFHVQACSAKGNISALKRTGGVVGAVYCGYAGNVVVDNCFFASGTSTRATLTVSNDRSKVWSGGVVGYCRGYITNSYAVASLTSSNDGHYICGIAGILQGSGPQASMSNSYAAVSISGNNYDYDRPLEGSVDGSNTLPITCCLYDSTLAGSFSNPIATGANKWGYWTATGYGTTTQMQGTGNVNAYSSTGSSYTTDTTKSALAVLGSAFEADSNSRNDGYPVLDWQNDSAALPAYVAGNGSSSGNDGTGIYLDGVNGSDSNSGTSISAPVKTVGKALELAEAQSPDYNIYVINTVTLSGSELQLSSGAYTGTIYRSRTFNGVLFSVPTNVTSTVQYVTIDGNDGNVSAAYSLFNVIGGTLTIGTNAVLQNNKCSDGGAINVSSGTATLSSGGTITGNSAQRGGAVYVVYGGTFNMSGGSITSNTSANTGGAVCTRGTFSMTGGTIGGSSAGNTAENGGAVAVMSDSSTKHGSFTMSSGTIRNNSATSYGGGVYVGTYATASMTGGNIGGITSSYANSAENGGGVATFGSFTLNGGTIRYNSASTHGGGVYAQSASCYTYTSGTIQNNTPDQTYTEP